MIEEADLCVTSCLRILKSVTKPHSDFDLVLECLKSIEACVSILQDRVMLDKKNKRRMEKLKRIVRESFQVSIKWCKRYLYGHEFSCYALDDTEKELQVCTCCLLTVLLVNESLASPIKIHNNSGVANDESTGFSC